MVLQSVTILVILLYVNYFDRRSDASRIYALHIRDLCIWLTVAVTLLSGIGYVRRGISLYKGRSAMT